MKEHVRVTGIAPPKLSTAPTLPLDMVLIRDLPLPLQKAVVGFLMRKNMDLIHFDQDLYYSDSRKRIMVPTAQGWIGRDTTENSPQKWLMYGNVPYLGEVRQGGTAVLVEDAFSWFKLKWSIKNDERFRFTDPICTLGTNARDSLFLVLVQRSVASLWFYDGDSAGIKGAGKGAARLTVFGVHSTPATAPSGLDPKDMSAEGIRQHLLTHLYGGELGCEHSSSPE